MLPPLYGGNGAFGSDVPVLAPLERTRPLTERQIKLLMRCVDVMKAFLHADGYEGGLSMKDLDDPSCRFAIIQLIGTHYWSELPIIQDLLLEYLVANPKSENDGHDDEKCTSNGAAAQEEAQRELSDALLKLLRIRMQQNSAAREFFAQQLQLREQKLKSKLVQ